MRKSLFFIPAAVLALASCSNDDFDGANNGYQGETETRYLSVNIVDNYSGTRAEDDKKFEDGLDSENAVSYIRFYLFGQNGFKNQSVDCTAEKIDNTGSPNVEKMLHSVIVFEGRKSNGSSTVTEPIQIVAVVNPPEGLATEYESPYKLQDVLGDYNITTSGKFILSNSVFVTNDEEHVAYSIDKSYTSREEALLNPVEIYVERVVAKARVETKMTKVEGKDYYNIFTSSQNKNGTIGIEIFDPTTEKLVKTDIYLKLLGWNVTGTASETRLVKKVETGWNNIDGLKGWWNDEKNNRSYWAENTEDVGSKDNMTFGQFTPSSSETNDAVKAAAATAIKGFTTETDYTDKPLNYTYLMENAAKNASGISADYATKLIVAGQLVDNECNGVNLAWWKGTYYRMNDLLDVFAAESNIYSKTGNTYTPLDSQNLEYKTSTEVNGETAPTDKRYYSYVQLKNNLSTEGTEWYIKDGKGDYSKIAYTDATSLATAVNNILKKLDIVKVWNDGYTYYWTDITHIAEKPAENATNYGYTGIVRNHIYDYTLSGFIGLGIPVLKPSETIYPEEPEDPEYAFIAARINVLSWRFIGHPNTVLGWD